MAEDTQADQESNLGETIQQVQQGTVQQKQESLIERKGYGPLVEPAPDAFPLHYRSPYIPGPGTGDAAASSESAPVVNPEQSSVSATSTTGATTQQGEGS